MAIQKSPTKMDKITHFFQKIKKSANFMNFRYFFEEKIFFNENSNCWFSANYSPKGTREHALESSRSRFFNFQNFMKNSCFLPYLNGIYSIIEERILEEKIAISIQKSRQNKILQKRDIIEEKVFKK